MLYGTQPCPFSVSVTTRAQCDTVGLARTGSLTSRRHDAERRCLSAPPRQRPVSAARKEETRLLWALRTSVVTMPRTATGQDEQQTFMTGFQWLSLRVVDGRAAVKSFGEADA